MVGATITPRAVVGAVHKALMYVDQHKTTLFMAQNKQDSNAPLESK
jgi:electron transport complex protein RnfG